MKANVFDLVEAHTMHLDLSYSKTVDWWLRVYKKGCGKDGRDIICGGLGCLLWWIGVPPFFGNLYKTLNLNALAACRRRGFRTVIFVSVVNTIQTRVTPLTRTRFVVFPDGKN